MDSVGQYAVAPLMLTTGIWFYRARTLPEDCVAEVASTRPREAKVTCAKRQCGEESFKPGMTPQGNNHPQASEEVADQAGKRRLQGDMDKRT